MSAEAVRIVADAFRDHLVAFNELLAEVPRDAADDAPLQIGAVYDSFADGWLARDEVPREGVTLTLPALLIGAPQDDTTSPSDRVAGGASILGPRYAHGTSSVTVQYYDHRSRTERARLASSYTLRAVRGWLMALARAPVQHRQRNGFQLLDLTQVRQMDIYVPSLGQSEKRQHVDAAVTGAVLSTWSTRESVPTITTFA